MGNHRDVTELSAIAFGDGLVKAAESAMTIAKEELAASLVSTLAKTGLEIAASFWIGMVLSVFGGFLRRRGSETLALRRTLHDDAVSTALEQMHQASQTPLRLETQAYRAERYRAAQVSLDKAYTRSGAEKKPVISLLRGVVAMNIDGGSHEAKRHLSEFQTASRSIIERLRLESTRLNVAANDLDNAASKIDVPVTPGAGGGMVGMAKATPMIEAEQKRQSARSNRSKAASIDCRVRWLEDVTRAVDVLVHRSTIDPEPQRG